MLDIINHININHINPVKLHPERITQKDKEFVNDVNYEGIEFPADKENFSKIETKNLSNLHFRSKTWKFNGLVAYNQWKQVTLSVYQRF